MRKDRANTAAMLGVMLAALCCLAAGWAFQSASSVGSERLFIAIEPSDAASAR